MDSRSYWKYHAVMDECARETHAALAIAQENRDGSLLWTFFPQNKMKRIDLQRQGFLLYRKQAGR